MQAMSVGLERIHGSLIGGVFIDFSECAVVVCEWATWVNMGVCVCLKWISRGYFNLKINYIFLVLVFLLFKIEYSERKHQFLIHCSICNFCISFSQS